MFSLSEPEICRNILESLPTGMCVIDMQKKIVFWSDGAERITGHLRHEVIGHSCVGEALLHCDQPGCEFCSEDCPLARAIKTSHPAEATGFLHHKAGHEIPVCMRAVPIHNQRGSIIGAVETFENLQAAPSPDDRDATRQIPDLTDAVTGVASRAMTLSHLRQTMTTYTKVQVPFAVFFFRVEGAHPFPRQPGAGSRVVVAAGGGAHSGKQLVDHGLRGALERRSVSGDSGRLPRAGFGQRARARSPQPGRRKH